MCGCVPPPRDCVPRRKEMRVSAIGNRGTRFLQAAHGAKQRLHAQSRAERLQAVHSAAARPREITQRGLREAQCANTAALAPACWRYAVEAVETLAVALTSEEGALRKVIAGPSRTAAHAIPPRQGWPSRRVAPAIRRRWRARVRSRPCKHELACGCEIFGAISTVFSGPLSRCADRRPARTPPPPTPPPPRAHREVHGVRRGPAAGCKPRAQLEKRGERTPVGAFSRPPETDPPRPPETDPL